MDMEKKAKGGSILYCSLYCAHRVKIVLCGFIHPAYSIAGQHLLCSLPAGSCWRAVFPVVLREQSSPAQASTQGLVSAGNKCHSHRVIACGNFRIRGESSSTASKLQSFMCRQGP